jgi:arylformamidase
LEIEDPICVSAAELRRHDLRPGERILFRTRNSAERWHERPFDERFVYISLDAAKLLASQGVQTVGIDYLSVGGYKGDNHEIHRVLLRAGIWVIEGLDLSTVSAGDYTLLCLPLRIVGSDGAPARALVRPARPA